MSTTTLPVNCRTTLKPKRLERLRRMLRQAGQLTTVYHSGNGDGTVYDAPVSVEVNERSIVISGDGHERSIDWRTVVDVATEPTALYINCERPFAPVS